MFNCIQESARVFLVSTSPLSSQHSLYEKRATLVRVKKCLAYYYHNIVMGYSPFNDDYVKSIKKIPIRFLNCFM